MSDRRPAMVVLLAALLSSCGSEPPPSPPERGQGGSGSDQKQQQSPEGAGDTQRSSPASQATEDAASKKALFPTLQLAEDADDMVKLVLKQDALNSRPPEGPSEEERRLVIDPRIHPLNDLRGALLDKWVPGDAVFVKKLRWLPLPSGTGPEDGKPVDALVARFSAEDTTIQLVYTVDGIMLYAEREAPFLEQDQAAMRADLTQLLAAFLRGDLCARIPPTFDMRHAEAVSGEPVTLAVIPIMPTAPSRAEAGLTTGTEEAGPSASQSAAAVPADGFRLSLTVSGGHLGLSLTRLRAPKPAEAAGAERAALSLFADPASRPEVAPGKGAPVPAETPGRIIP